MIAVGFIAGGIFATIVAAVVAEMHFRQFARRCDRMIVDARLSERAACAAIVRDGRPDCQEEKCPACRIARQIEARG